MASTGVVIACVVVLSLYIFMNDLIAMGYKTISELYGRFKNGRPKGFKNHGKISEEVLSNIAVALFRLHSMGISHKDLHPSNVFYDPEREKAIVFAPISDTEMSWQSRDFREISAKWNSQRSDR